MASQSSNTLTASAGEIYSPSGIGTILEGLSPGRAAAVAVQEKRTFITGHGGKSPSSLYMSLPRMAGMTIAEITGWLLIGHRLYRGMSPTDYALVTDDNRPSDATRQGWYSGPTRARAAELIKIGQTFLQLPDDHPALWFVPNNADLKALALAGETVLDKIVELSAAAAAKEAERIKAEQTALATRSGHTAAGMQESGVTDPDIFRNHWNIGLGRGIPADILTAAWTAAGVEIPTDTK